MSEGVGRPIHSSCIPVSNTILAIFIFFDHTLLSVFLVLLLQQQTIRSSAPSIQRFLLLVLFFVLVLLLGDNWQFSLSSHTHTHTNTHIMSHKHTNSTVLRISLSMPLIQRLSYCAHRLFGSTPSQDPTTIILLRLSVERTVPVFRVLVFLIEKPLSEKGRAHIFYLSTNVTNLVFFSGLFSLRPLFLSISVKRARV